MRPEDLRKLVDGTLDAAYVVDSQGILTAWNDGASALFGITAAEAVGRSCQSIIEGADESGRVCSANCMIRQAIQRGKTVSSFDMEVQTSEGRKWCNASVLVVETASCSAPHAIYIMRPVDVAKRLEFAVRDYLMAHSRSFAEEGSELLTSTSATHHADLSERELEVLRMLASGGSTKSTAADLHISRATVNNHIQHILKKLDSHSRLEAIRRAERTGLV
jgi:PAS domain S-box-containing protein